LHNFYAKLICFWGKPPDPQLGGHSPSPDPTPSLFSIFIPHFNLTSTPLDESLVENPGFRPGFRTARPGLRPARDKLKTFRVENLVESVLDRSQHVVIDLARFRPNRDFTGAQDDEAGGYVSNVQSSNGFATCFQLVCDPLAHVTQVYDHDRPIDCNDDDGDK